MLGGYNAVNDRINKQRNKTVSSQVYQRADLNKMLMSMSVGPYCDLAQDVDSTNWTQGAVVSLVLDENERECKQG